MLMETDYAPPSLDQQKRYVTDLENQIQQTSTRITKLENKLQKELKDHEKYQSSILKRFAYKLSGKSDVFEARAKTEEREYFDALHDTHIAKQMYENTAKALDEAKAHQTALEKVAAQHVHAQDELNGLYGSIFHGPSPGFPEEDKAEEAAKNALHAFNDLRSQLEAQNQVLQILKLAQGKMRDAAKSLSHAHKSSQVDIFTRGIMADIVERHMLTRAEAELSETYQLVMQAQRLSPEVQPLPPIEVVSGHFKSDMLFDNPFSDISFNNKIKESQEEQRQASAALDHQVDRALRRLSLLSQNLSQISGALGQSRLALQRAREQAFQRVIRRNN